MLKKELRLTKTKDFNAVLNEKKVFQDDYFLLKFKKNNLKISRFGFIVSSKVSKKAVKRNYIKRRMRESIRLSHHHIKKGFDIVIIAKKRALELDFHLIFEKLVKLLKNAGLYE